MRRPLDRSPNFGVPPKMCTLADVDVNSMSRRRRFSSIQGRHLEAVTDCNYLFLQTLLNNYSP